MSKCQFVSHYLYDMNLGLKIKLARIAAGLTQEELAVKINKTRPLISYIEQTGKAGNDTLMAISRVLNISDLIAAGEPNPGYGVSINQLSGGNEQLNETIKSLETQIELLKGIIESQKQTIKLLEERKF